MDAIYLHYRLHSEMLWFVSKRRKIFSCNWRETRVEMLWNYSQSRQNGRPIKVAGRKKGLFFFQITKSFLYYQYWIKPEIWPSIDVEGYKNGREITSMSILLRVFLDIWITINSQNQQPCVNKIVRLQLWCSMCQKRVLKMR